MQKITRKLQEGLKREGEKEIRCGRSHCVHVKDHGMSIFDNKVFNHQWHGNTRITHSRASINLKINLIKMIVSWSISTRPTPKTLEGKEFYSLP